MCTPHDEKHTAHLGGGMHEYANGKYQYKVYEVLAVIITVTVDRLLSYKFGGEGNSM